MSIKNNTPDLQSILDTINTLPDYVDTTGTATAADIYTGKTATVNAKKLTGTNPYNAANVDPAVADALAALVEKGVDTTGAGLAELAALIAAIESGAKITTGRITPSAPTQNLTITHGLGEIPTFFFIFNFYKDYIGALTVQEAYAFYHEAKIYKHTAVQVSSSQIDWRWFSHAGIDLSAPETSPSETYFYPHLYGATDSTITWGLNESTNANYKIHNSSYGWIAIKIDGGVFV